MLLFEYEKENLLNLLLTRYTCNMNKNLTVQNVGILIELGFTPAPGFEPDETPPDRLFNGQGVMVAFWANDNIQISTVGNPSSHIVNTFVAALEFLEDLGIK